MEQLGAKVTEDWKKKYAQSKHWKDGKFHNLEPTSMEMSLAKMPRLIYQQLTMKDRSPKQPLPIIPFDAEKFLEPSAEPKFVWYGHSAILLRINGKTIFMDPMMGPDSAPIGPIRVRRFSQNTLDILKSLPDIDLVMLSHDHYDHLDMASIQILKSKTAQFFVALGVERNLIYWGIPAEKIRSFDWWDSERLADIEIHFTPSRHFSGRGLRDRFKGLWGGWVLNDGRQKLYCSGDGGYGAHFREVGERLGPFNFGWMECGQYNADWQQIHMFPEEAVQAALDARVEKAMPIHWGAFALALHRWDEPPTRFLKAAEEKGLRYMLPPPGKIVSPADELSEAWWTPYA